MKVDVFRECKLFSRISTIFEKVNLYQFSCLLSRKSNFFEKFIFFWKSNIFLCCGPQFIIMKARRSAVPVSNAFYAKSWRQSSPQTPQANEYLRRYACHKTQETINQWHFAMLSLWAWQHKCICGRSNHVKPVLRKKLNEIKPTNTPNKCVVEEICVP